MTREGLTTNDKPSYIKLVDDCSPVKNSIETNFVADGRSSQADSECVIGRVEALEILPKAFSTF